MKYTMAGFAIDVVASEVQSSDLEIGGHLETNPS